MNKQGATTVLVIALLAYACAQVIGPPDKAPPPPKVDTPESEVIQPDRGAAPRGEAAPLVREGRAMVYRQFNTACNVAAETHRPLLVVVSEDAPSIEDHRLVVAHLSPKDQALGHRASNRELFEGLGFAVPCAVFVASVRWGVQPQEFVELDPANLDESLAEHWRPE